ncbi:MAG TPA: TIM barrel protein, partial [Candidatus Obscuribacterales bacterium]
MALAGYAGTELGDLGFMPTEPQKLQAELRQRNLTMLAAFVPVDLSDASAHEEGQERALSVARLLKAVSETPFIVLSDDNAKNPVRLENAGRIEKKHGLSDRQWTTLTRGAEKIARTVLDETGVKTVFHHHCAGFIETADEIERFLANTDPLLIGLCLDTGHYAFGGGDPVRGFERHAKRIWHVHFKDCHPEVRKQSRANGWNYFQSVRNGIFCELGRGSVNFSEIVRLMRRERYSGWIVVEQDVLPGMGTPLDSARRSREYLSTLGL